MFIRKNRLPIMVFIVAIAGVGLYYLSITYKKVDALYKQADALSEEAGVWSDKLYAESQELQKEFAADKAEIAKRREMRRDPTVDEETLKAFDEALDARVRATNAKAVQITNMSIQNDERRDEAMRLRAEARRLLGFELLSRMKLFLLKHGSNLLIALACVYLLYLIYKPAKIENPALEEFYRLQGLEPPPSGYAYIQNEDGSTELIKLDSTIKGEQPCISERTGSL